MPKPIDYAAAFARYPRLLALHTVLERVQPMQGVYRVVAATPFIIRLDGTLFKDETIAPRLMKYWLVKSEFLLRAEVDFIAAGMRLNAFNESVAAYVEERAGLVLKWLRKIERQADRRIVHDLQSKGRLN